MTPPCRAFFQLIAALSVSAPALSEGSRTEGKQLRAAEIRQTLSGKLVSYSPPGWADVGVHEEFRDDGTWGGIHYGRGPDPFSGRWTVKNDKLCVTAESGSIAQKWHPSEYCRKVWQVGEMKQLRMGYLLDQPSSSHNFGPQVLSVKPLLGLR